MFIEHLHVERFRSLDWVDINLSRRLNVFFGENGAGKTSLLESVAFLSTGRSFLTPRYQTTIQDGANDALVAARLSGHSGARQLGIQRSLDGKVTARVNGDPVTGLSHLARELPYLVVGAEGLGWMVGSPQRRRSLLDWGVFHVLGESSEVYQRYRKALDQRNKALKNAKISRAELQTWDVVLAGAGEQIVQLRQRYFELLSALMTRLLGDLIDLPKVELNLKSGYSGDKGSLLDAFERGFERDRLLGTTQSGPHRGDLTLSCRGVAVTDGLSRGQQKVLASTLVLAQQQLLIDTQDRQVILLVDDLAAELDDQRQGELLSRMAETGAQWLLSAVGSDKVQSQMLSRISGLMDNAGDVRMFHVKQGAVAESD